MGNLIIGSAIALSIFGALALAFATFGSFWNGANDSWTKKIVLELVVFGFGTIALSLSALSLLDYAIYTMNV